MINTDHERFASGFLNDWNEAHGTNLPRDLDKLGV